MKSRKILNFADLFFKNMHIINDGNYDKWNENYRTKNLDDGNCFYSAVYRSIIEKNMFECAELLGINYDEMKSIKKLRKVISDHITEDTVELLYCYRDEWDEDFVKDTSLEGIDLDRDKISVVIRKLKKNIKTMEIWATMIEYNLLTVILKEYCGIKLILVNESSFINKDYDISDPKAIYLANDDDHFEHFLP